MFYIRDTYAKVWNKIRVEDKYTDLRISTSEKDQEGNRQYSNWFVRCLGAAHNKAKSLKEGSSIKILKAKIQNVEKRDEDGNFMPYGSNIKIIIFDFDKDDGTRNSNEETDNKKSKSNTKTQNKKDSKKSKQEFNDDEDEDLDIPFL